MPMYETIDLTICADCAMIFANGADDEDQRAHLLRMHEHTADWKGTISSDEITHDFSDLPCQTCGTHLAGTRYAATLLTPVADDTVDEHGNALGNRYNRL